MLHVKLDVIITIISLVIMVPPRLLAVNVVVALWSPHRCCSHIVAVNILIAHKAYDLQIPGGHYQIDVLTLMQRTQRTLVVDRRRAKADCRRDGLASALHHVAGDRTSNRRDSAHIHIYDPDGP